MKRFVEGTARQQSTLFPAVLDEYVGEDNPVRAIDVFVDGLGRAPPPHGLRAEGDRRMMCNKSRSAH
jgi:hypothetical protein